MYLFGNVHGGLRAVDRDVDFPLNPFEKADRNRIETGNLDRALETDVVSLDFNALFFEGGGDLFLVDAAVEVSAVVGRRGESQRIGGELLDGFLSVGNFLGMGRGGLGLAGLGKLAGLFGRDSRQTLRDQVVDRVTALDLNQVADLILPSFSISWSKISSIPPFFPFGSLDV